MSERNRVLLIATALVGLGVFSCSRDSFLPMQFEQAAGPYQAVANTVRIPLSPLDSAYKEMTIAPGRAHLYWWTAAPYRCYRARFETQRRLWSLAYARVRGARDSIPLSRTEVPSGWLPYSVAGVFAPCTLFLDVRCSISAPQTHYAVSVVSERLDSAGQGAYRSAAVTYTPDLPLRASLTDGNLSDTLTFDHELTTYSYAVALDSFEMLSYRLGTLKQGWDEAQLVLQSTHYTTLPDERRASGRYWSDIEDTLYAVVHLFSRGADSIYREAGVYPGGFPIAVVEFDRKQLNVAPADAFYGLPEPVFLEPDIAYGLSIFDETKDDFYFDVSADLLYELLVVAVDSPGVRTRVLPTDGTDVSADVTGSDTLVFRPAPSHDYAEVEVTTLDGFPGGYTLLLRGYTGSDTVDAYENDGSLETATTLTEGVAQNHTFFPPNEYDFYTLAFPAFDTVQVRVCTHGSRFTARDVVMGVTASPTVLKAGAVSSDTCFTVMLYSTRPDTGNFYLTAKGNTGGDYDIIVLK
jgi:hypothetical protein